MIVVKCRIVWFCCFVNYFLAFRSTMASSELLKQIQAGKNLKKAVTNDRSAPSVGGSKGGGGGAAGGAGHSASTIASAGAGVGAGSAGPPQIGGLFAGGIPKLKPAGSSGSSLKYEKI